MIDDNTWNGVNSFLDNYVECHVDDFFIVVYSSDSYKSAAWLSSALQIRGINSVRVWVMPIQDPGFEDRLSSVLPEVLSLNGRLIVATFEKNTMSHTTSLNKLISRYPKEKVKIFRTISACDELFSTAFSVSPDELEKRNSTLLKRLMSCSKLRIKTQSGSDLRITLDNRKHRWISNRGRAKSGGTVILPAGEIATFPSSIEGIFVADFAFNVNAITEIDSRLSDKPVRVLINDGRAVDYSCDDDFIRRFLTECFHTHCAFNVGELGLGTNTAVKEPIHMNSHINERRCGVHIGFGQHNQDPSVVSYYCPIHLDLIARGGLLWIDGDLIPIDLETFEVKNFQHPLSTRDEDVFSPELDDLEIDDCCGVLTGEGFGLFKSPTCST